MTDLTARAACPTILERGTVVGGGLPTDEPDGEVTDGGEDTDPSLGVGVVRSSCPEVTDGASDCDATESNEVVRFLESEPFPSR